MLQHLLLTDADVERIRDVALETLETAGMMLQSERFLKALEAKGARIDWPGERAFIPRSLVQQVIDSERAANKPDAAPAPASLPRPALPGVGTQVAQLFHDYSQGRVREPLEADLVRMIRFGDALHRERGVGHTLIMRDVPQPLEPLHAQALLIEHTHKPSSAYFYYVEQLEYAAEIGEIYCGDRGRFTGGGVFLTSPLRLCRRSCSLMAKRIDMGFAGSAGTMPVAGASVPATMAGAIAVTAAEILGVWTAYRALREDVPVRSGIAAGATDMRTGNVSFSSPEAMMLNFGVSEFFRRLCGTRLGVAGAADYCDAKTPGIRALLEKAHKVMTVAAFNGCYSCIGSGMVDSGKTLSPEQLLLERDLSAGTARLFHPVDVTDDTLALETILQIGPGITETHLESEHTLLHFREALWSPSLLIADALTERGHDLPGDEQLLARAHEQFEETLQQYEPPEVDADRLRAIRKVIERARQQVPNWDLG